MVSASDCPQKFVLTYFFSLASEGEKETTAIEGADIDPHELVQVSAEHENQDSSTNQPGNGLVNDITKQQMIVQFLKVRKFGLLSLISCFNCMVNFTDN